MILKDKTYLVTGAAQGIGLGICKSILEAGGKVSMIDINEDQLNDSAFELEKISICNTSLNCKPC